MSFNVDERKSLLKAWMTAARPFGAKVIAQVGGAPLPDVLELVMCAYIFLNKYHFVVHYDHYPPTLGKNDRE